MPIRFVPKSIAIKLLMIRVNSRLKTLSPIGVSNKRSPELFISAKLANQGSGVVLQVMAWILAETLRLEFRMGELLSAFDVRFVECHKVA
jgi:hypothetical protein